MHFASDIELRYLLSFQPLLLIPVMLRRLTIDCCYRETRLGQALHLEHQKWFSFLRFFVALKAVSFLASCRTGNCRPVFHVNRYSTT